MATGSKEENSTCKAQALYVIRYQSFALLKTARASRIRFFRMLSQANLGAGAGGGGRTVTDILISGSTKKDRIFQWMHSFLTLNS